MRLRLLSAGLALGLLAGMSFASWAAPQVKGGGGIGGTCATTNALAKFTAAFTTACSAWTDTGTTSTYGGSTISISGSNAQLSSASGINLDVRTTGADTLFFGTNGTRRWDVNGSTGNLESVQVNASLAFVNGGFLNSVLTNTAAYTAITGAGCGAATECFFAIGADGSVPAGAINAAKHRLEIEWAGVYGANATDTLTLKAKICTVSGCGSGTVIQLASTGAVTMGAATAQPFNLRIVCNVFTAGSGGTLDCQGSPGANFFTAISTVIVDDIFNAATVTVDTTVAEFVSGSATWSSTNAANTITLRNFGVKVF